MREREVFIVSGLKNENINRAVKMSDGNIVKLFFFSKIKEGKLKPIENSSSKR